MQSKTAHRAEIDTSLSEVPNSRSLSARPELAAALPPDVADVITRLDRLDVQAEEIRRCAESMLAAFSRALQGF